MNVSLRSAQDDDLVAIDALLRPHVQTGTMLPRKAGSKSFVVATQDGRVVGTVALLDLAPGVAELTSLVTVSPGRGLGRRLVECILRRAAHAGYHSVTALSASPSFFERCGFRRDRHPPWAQARSAGNPLRVMQPSASLATHAKAKTCRTCDRLTSCRQAFMIRPVWREAA